MSKTPLRQQHTRYPRYRESPVVPLQVSGHLDGRRAPQVLEDQRRLGAGDVGVGIEVFDDE
jgi:hypothetical protein